MGIDAREWEPSRLREFQAESQRDPELARKAEQAGGATGELEPDQALPAFPKTAFRGLFAKYRDVMRRCSEASDVYHFTALWSALGNALGRRVWFPYGMKLYANTYMIAFGPTGDFKTSACRHGAGIIESAGLRVSRGVGSGEGITDGLGEEPTLFFLEEFTSLLRQRRWEGSTLLSVFTEIFDCPECFERRYRKNPISLDHPVCSVLAGTIAAWFWRDVREMDFEGGFGNRFIYLTGPPNEPVPRPSIPDLGFAVEAIRTLKNVPEQETALDAGAEKLWDRFYIAWRKERLSPLETAATKRVPSYSLKLAMVYAALEDTIPVIRAEQLSAAILVVSYASQCLRQLIGERYSGANAHRELEKRIQAAVSRAPGCTITKRELCRALARHYQNAEHFNRVFDSLVRAGDIYTRPQGRGRVLVSTQPFD
jgi:hypothetical protein